MLKNLKLILPSVNALLATMILPIIVVFYALYIQFNARLGKSTTDVFSAFTGNYHLMQIVGRGTDLLLWGGVAAIVLVIIWFIGVARTTVDNHYTEESFVNFTVPKSTWHGHFYTMIAVKIALSIGLLSSIFILLFRLSPLLHDRVVIAAKTTSQHTVVLAIDTVLLIIAVQYLAVLLFKVLRHSKVE